MSAKKDLAQHLMPWLCRKMSSKLMDPCRFSRPKVGAGIKCIMAPVQYATINLEQAGSAWWHGLSSSWTVAGQIEFRPTVELWSGGRPTWMTQASTIKGSFSDNGTVERIQELLENLDQRN